MAPDSFVANPALPSEFFSGTPQLAPFRLRRCWAPRSVRASGAAALTASPQERKLPTPSQGSGEPPPRLSHGEVSFGNRLTRFLTSGSLFKGELNN